MLYGKKKEALKMSQVLPTTKVIRNEPSQIAALLIDERGIKLPTSGLISVSLFVQKEDNTYLEKSAASGLIWGYGDTTSLYIFNFTAEETILFKLGSEQSAFLKITYATSHLTFELKSFLTVAKDLVNGV
jgi:hypothetical protein